MSIGVALVAVFVAVGSPAAAHTSLIDSNPAAGESVSELERIRLEFSDPLLEVGTVVTVVDSNDQPQDVQHEHISDTVVEAEFPFAGPGEYVIEWRVVADDGHPIDGVIAFTLESVPEVTEAPGMPEPTPSPESALTPQAQESPSPSPSPTALPEEPEEESEPGLSPWLAAGLALLAAALVTVVWKLTRKKDH